MEDKDASQFMARILWGNLFRERMCWLDFMAYLCSRGKKEENYDYLYDGKLTPKDKKELKIMTEKVNAAAEALLPRKAVKQKKLIYIYKGMKGARGVSDTMNLSRFKSGVACPLARLFHLA